MGFRNDLTEEEIKIAMMNVAFTLAKNSRNSTTITTPDGNAQVYLKLSMT